MSLSEILSYPKLMTDSDLYKLRGEGKLKLKRGVLALARKRKRPVEPSNEKSKEDMDCLRHGGWKWITDLKEVKGAVSLQSESGQYLRAIDDGSIIEGECHDIGNGPIPQEIMTAIVTDIDKGILAFKTGFNRYISASGQKVSARAEAIGHFEQWTCTKSHEVKGCFTIAVDKTSICPSGSVVKIRMCEAKYEERQKEAADNCSEFVPKYIEKYIQLFLLNHYLADTEGIIGRITCPTEYSEIEYHIKSKGSLAKKDLRQFEENQVRMYQKFQDKKLRMNPGAVDDLRSARKDGHLHESLLDRREKMKSDRYCK